MFAFKAHLDNRVGVNDEGSDLGEVTVATITSAIDRLDGKNHTLVTVEGPDEYMFFVGGGSDGLYLVSYDKGGREFGELLAASGNGDITVKLGIGGQSVRKRREQCVNKEVAVDAAVHFACYGERLPSGRWRVRSD